MFYLENLGLLKLTLVKIIVYTISVHVRVHVLPLSLVNHVHVLHLFSLSLVKVGLCIVAGGSIHNQ